MKAVQYLFIISLAVPHIISAAAAECKENGSRPIPKKSQQQRIQSTQDYRQRLQEHFQQLSAHASHREQALASAHDNIPKPAIPQTPYRRSYAAATANKKDDAAAATPLTVNSVIPEAISNYPLLFIPNPNKYAVVLTADTPEGLDAQLAQRKQQLALARAQVQLQQLLKMQQLTDRHMKRWADHDKALEDRIKQQKQKTQEAIASFVEQSAKLNQDIAALETNIAALQSTLYPKPAESPTPAPVAAPAAAAASGGLFGWLGFGAGAQTAEEGKKA